MDIRPEVWQRGPVPGVPAALMPAAHAFLQTLEDVEQVLRDCAGDQVWETPGGAASVGFHLLHLAGSTDRLLTYARGERLAPDQRDALAREQAPDRPPTAPLLEQLRLVIGRALDQLRATDPATLYEPRAIGRAALPTTVAGLIFHAAEHSQRHAGQLVTTARIVRGLASARTLEAPAADDQTLDPAPLDEDGRQRLGQLRGRLLALHKVLLDDTRTAYELDRGRVGSNANLLQLVINDPWFAWLHAISELVVRIDQIVEDPRAAPGDANTMVDQVDRQLTASESGDGFARRYFDALQRQPAVVLAHADVRRTLKSMR